MLLAAEAVEIRSVGGVDGFFGPNRKVPIKIGLLRAWMRQDEGRDVPGIRDRQEGLLPRGI